jgi:alkylhydroperoxidase family enzyme
MTAFDYSGAGVSIRADLRDTHRFIWEHLRAPGTWWTGQQRLAIAAESRNATGCTLCRERKTALSPNAVSGSHDTLGELPDNVVEAVHRIRTDPARLSRAWFEGVSASGIDETNYVELVGIVTLLAGVDYFARALGIAPFRLPEPLAGEPSRYRPVSAKPGTAWVSMIAPEDAHGLEADLYAGWPFVPNIMRALSLVPNEARALQRSSNAHYVPVAQIGDPTVRKSLDRMQMELVAARVSALNECFY